MQKILIFVVLIIAVFDVHAATDTTFIIGKPAPLFRLLNQNSSPVVQFNLADQFSPDSQHVVMLSFFATWCAPCRKELPFLQTIADSLQAAGVRLVAVCIDSEYGEQQRQAVIEMKLHCTVIHDKYGIVARRYECKAALPYTIFIDKRGVVAEVSTGFDETQITVLRNKISKLLKDKK